MPAVACGIIGTYGDNEALDADIAERNEYAPPRIKLGQCSRDHIGERTRNAFDRDIDIDIRDGHMFTFSTKKPLHEDIRATAPFRT